MRLTPAILLLACAGACAPGCGDDGARRPDAEPIDAARDATPPDGSADGAPEDVLPADVRVDDAPWCDPASGQPTAGLCRLSFECRCPSVCLQLDPAPATGSCFTTCDPQASDPGGHNPGCGATEICATDPPGASGCLPLGTLSGSFSALPMYTPPAEPASAADLGTAQVTLAVGSIGELPFESGWGTTVTRGGASYYRLMLFPGSGPTVDFGKPLYLELRADDGYAPGASYDFAADPERAAGSYHELSYEFGLLRRDVLRARVRSGTLTLGEAGTGDRAPVSGTLAGAAVLQYESELCGEASVKCE